MGDVPVSDSVSLRRLVGLLFAPGLTRTALDRWVRVVLLVTYMASIFYVSGLPGSDISVEVDDRAGHALAYAGLGVLLMFAGAAFVPRWSTAATVLMIVAGVLYGASDEWHQSMVPSRDSSMKDLVFDAIGTIVGVLLVRLALARSSK